jgi:hypothetical protein
VLFALGIAADVAKDIAVDQVKSRLGIDLRADPHKEASRIARLQVEKFLLEDAKAKEKQRRKGQ